MFQRNALFKLKEWSENPYRKPLVLRGARQVGKTTLVNIFAQNFIEFISLNLEIPGEKAIFEDGKTISEIISAIFFVKGKPVNSEKTLIFIDEIQTSPKAVTWLRYFYEEAPQFYVIAAGSLLESLIDNQISFPVGRVSYLPVRPFSYSEFLQAMGETQSLEVLTQIPFPEYAHEKLLDLFRKYTLIGGMPEIVKNYAVKPDIVAISSVYDELLTSYLDDVEKYSKNSENAKVLRHIISNIFNEAGRRITFEKFGNSNYRSREMKEAFLTLEKTFLLNLVYPVTSTQLPLSPDYKKSPKLQVIDTGLINYSAGLQKEFFGTAQLTDIYRGKIAEHITGQELLSINYSMTKKNHFWIKEKISDAEIDFVYQYDGMIIPVEVKSGKSGKLRSLNEFMETANHNYAIRVYSEKLSISKSTTRLGKPFWLLNLPFYLVHKIEDYCVWFINEVNNESVE
jgi:predicted AAA+ superfamily ATPase